MSLRSPIADPSPVAVNAVTPVLLFSSRSAKNLGWNCVNNTDQTVFFYETITSDVPSAALVKSAGLAVAPTLPVESDFTSSFVWVLAMVAPTAPGLLYGIEVAA